jgi:hypothetical protein
MTRHSLSIAGIAAALALSGCYAGSDDLPADESTGDAATTGADTAADTSGGPELTTTGGEATTTTGATDGTTGEPEEEGLGALGYTADDARSYLATIAPMVVGRLLTAEEDNLIYHFGADAIVPIVESWVQEPAFADTARAMLQVKLAASGSKDGIDFELPGNLAAHLARNDRPYAELLTAPYCVDAVGNAIPCDTGAPYAAGVLTTRAYLIANASRFNLRRARRMMFIFSCNVYPMDTTLQPPIAKESLIPMFQALTKEEQTVPEAANGFGNGAACYSCHSQFSAHAQLFVRFSQDGLWHAEATGLQDPMNELGRSINGLYASHFASPVVAPKEISQMFGQPVNTLVDAGRVLAQGPGFYTCASRNVLEYSFGMSESEAVSIDRDLLADLSEQALARDLRLRPETAGTLAGGPTFGDLFVVALTHPRVLQVVLGLPNPDGAADE